MRRMFNLIPKCLRRFPDGLCFYVSGNTLCAINRLEFCGFYAATWDELWTRYRRYWRKLPVMLPAPGKNWW